MIDVIKLPNELDITYRIKRKMLDVYGTCPYCLNEELRDYETRYGVSYESIKCGIKPIRKGLLKRKECKWERYVFTCHNCGMVWGSPEFPILENDIKLNTAIFNSWKNRQMDMEVKTLLLGVINCDENKRN